MAYNFSANQFEEGYTAKRLGNWEVPKWYPSHPRTPHTTTKFIADSRGHLLPGVSRGNPWGSYKSTWELPRRITKTYAEKVNAPPSKLQVLWGKRPAPAHIQQITQSEPQKLPVIDPESVESFLRRNKSCPALERSGTPSKEKTIEAGSPAVPAQQSTPNIPPDTLQQNVKQILQTCQEEQDRTKSPTLCRAIEVLHETKHNVEQGEQCQQLDEMVKSREEPKKKFGGPLMNDYSSFQVAKRYHDENLKHQPLADVVDDPLFKALASNKHPYPGSGLCVQRSGAAAAAIGWRSAGAPAPTKCSKLKVYRPNTSAQKPKPELTNNRPKTCVPLKDRFGPIDLAICWDLAPEERPRRIHRHIDGSDGGEAPAVFNMVRPEESHPVAVQGSAQAVASHVPHTVQDNNVGTLPSKIVQADIKKPTNKSAIMSQVKPIEDSPVTSFHSLSPESAEIARKNPKTAWTSYDTSKEISHRLTQLERSELQQVDRSEALIKSKVHRSSPNLSPTKVCEGSNCGTDSVGGKPKESSGGDSGKKPKEHTDLKDSKEEYKMAFKAGMPRSTPPPQPSKPLKMPKMRPPFAKKNYSISTLMPPFSLWPDHHGQEYPEHWRLASVYQHSYKPVVARRKPLLASIFQ